MAGRLATQAAGGKGWLRNGGSGLSRRPVQTQITLNVNGGVMSVEAGRRGGLLTASSAHSLKPSLLSHLLPPSPILKPFFFFFLAKKN